MRLGAEGWWPNRNESGFCVCVGTLRERSRDMLRLTSVDPLVAPVIDFNYLDDLRNLDDFVSAFAKRGRSCLSVLSTPSAAMPSRMPWAAARSDAEVDALIDSGIGQERLPPQRCLPDWRRSNVGRRSAGPGPRNGGPARGRQRHHAVNRARESQCAHGDDRRKRVRHAPRSDPASATNCIQPIDLTTF